MFIQVASLSFQLFFLHFFLKEVYSLRETIYWNKTSFICFSNYFSLFQYTLKDLQASMPWPTQVKSYDTVSKVEPRFCIKKFLNEDSSYVYVPL